MSKQIAFIAGIGVIAYLSLIPTAQFDSLTGSVVKILGLSLNDQLGGIPILKWIHYFGHFVAYFVLGMLIYNWHNYSATLGAIENYETRERRENE